MKHMLNITMRKVGGIRFIAIGRISISFSVSTPAAYAAKLNERYETAAFKAVVAALA